MRTLERRSVLLDGLQQLVHPRRVDLLAAQEECGHATRLARDLDLVGLLHAIGEGFERCTREGHEQVVPRPHAGGRVLGDGRFGTGRYRSARS